MDKLPVELLCEVLLGNLHEEREYRATRMLITMLTKTEESKLLDTGRTKSMEEIDMCLRQFLQKKFRLQELPSLERAEDILQAMWWPSLRLRRRLNLHQLPKELSPEVGQKIADLLSEGEGELAASLITEHKLDLTTPFNISFITRALGPHRSKLLPLMHDLGLPATDMEVERH